MSEAPAAETFFGDDGFPVEWEDGQKELFWVHDDLHIPNPVSPMSPGLPNRACQPSEIHA